MSEYRIEAEITQGQGPGRFVTLLIAKDAKSARKKLFKEMKGMGSIKIISARKRK